MTYDLRTTDGGNAYLGPEGTFAQIVDGGRAIAVKRDQLDADLRVAAQGFADKAASTRIPFRDVGRDLDLDTLTATEDVMISGMSGVLNSPEPLVGVLSVRNAGGNVIQTWGSIIRSPQIVHTRYKQGSGAWKPWQLQSPVAKTPKVAVSFDDLKLIGTYPIQSVSHPSQPAANVGTLEVLPSSGLVLQRFTTWTAPARVFLRTSLADGTWRPWQEQPAVGALTSLATRVNSLEASSGSSSGGATAYSVPTRAALTAYPAAVESKPAAAIITEMDTARLTGWNAYESGLSETPDYGATWRPLRDAAGSNPFAGSQVEAVTYLENDTLMVVATRGAYPDGRREVWLVEHLRDDRARTFTKTMTARAPGIKFTKSWSIDSHGPIVLVNEYGPKTGLTWGGNPVAAEENARYTYLSVDYGKTWRTIFDLNTYLTTAQGRASTDIQHLHGVAWDPWWDRVWVTFGDNNGGKGSNGVVYSDDLGATWQTAHYYSGANSPHQLVGIVPMPKCVLFGGDHESPDIVRIDRRQGKYPTDPYDLVAAFELDSPGQHLLQGHTRIRRAGDDAPALFAFGSEGSDAPSFVLATLDGWTFVEAWRDTVDQPAGYGCRSVVGPTLTGKIIIGSNDLKVDGLWTQITTTAPGY